MSTSFLSDYRKIAEQREQQGIPPMPLNAEQAAALCELIISPPQGETQFLLNLLSERIPPGVDPASEVKARFCKDVILGKVFSPIFSSLDAIQQLGMMMGGYNVGILVELLSNENADIAAEAAKQLAKLTLVYDAFNDVKALADSGNNNALNVLKAWAGADWFTMHEEVPEAITVTVFNVPGETNTDDLSPADHATTRPDIPLHAQVMLGEKMDAPLATIDQLKKKGHAIAYVGDVVGTGSSRKSAMNSVIWHIGADIPAVPNKRTGGVIIGQSLAPIFEATARDSGAFPITCDVSKMKTGDVITIFPYDGEICNENYEVIATFEKAAPTLFDELRAGGRIALTVGRALTAKARIALGLAPSDVFVPPTVVEGDCGFTLAQKMVGKACGVPGILPGTSCEPLMTTVGSQDTTGPMTRDEMKELACLGFSAGLVLQTFCHTAAYPKAADQETQATLPDFFADRGSVVINPGDGIIHSWMNRLLLPDTVGTGGDSHTRFPLGISFPAGSGLVAFAAATGAMPLDMPESVLVRFSGSLQPGITIRDVVNAIPYQAIKEGKLTVPKKNKVNVFDGRILEMEGLPNLKVEQAFELTDAAAERSCAAATIKLSIESVSEYLRSNIALMRAMIEAGYKGARALERRIAEMEAWLAEPFLMEADADAEYADVIEINLDEITVPVVAAPNDPDNVKLLTDPEVQGSKVDEVFIGSCMTNIGHYRVGGAVLGSAIATNGKLKSKLWFVPPTGMDEAQLRHEGIYERLQNAARETGSVVYDHQTAQTLSVADAMNAAMVADVVTDIPGCSLCMGNQARVEDEATVFSTSTRNFNNRMGKGAQVYLGSAELAAVCASLGRMPTQEEYMTVVVPVQERSGEFFRYMNFDQEEFAPALTALVS